MVFLAYLHVSQRTFRKVEKFPLRAIVTLNKTEIEKYLGFDYVNLLLTNYICSCNKSLSPKNIPELGS